MSGTVSRLYDSHAHLVSDDDVRYPRNPMTIYKKKDKPGARLPGTIGQPGGMHGPNPVNLKPTAQQLHGWMAEEKVIGIAAVQKGLIYGTDNSYIVDAADIYPDEMRAIIILDPHEDKTLPTIREYSKRGIVGVRLFPVSVEDKIAWFSSKQTHAMCELVADLGLALDLEAPVSNSEQLIPIVEQIADDFPSLRIVLDHLFMPDVLTPDYGIGASFEGFRKRDNISYKWTSLNMDVIREKGHAPEKVLRRAVDYYGADKIMWGSDIGTSSGTYNDLVTRAIASTVLLTDDERRKVLHDTGRRILMHWKGD